VDATRDIVSSVLDADLNEKSNQLNEITKKLASWAAIIAVPTAVTGFYGQNVPYPGFGRHYGFLESVIVMVVLAGGVFFLLRRRGWL
jgi:magnesium transporter